MNNFCALPRVLAVAATMPSEPSGLTGADQRAGWKALFDGRTLNGWRGLKSETPGASWKVEDGVIVSQGHTGDLLTTAEFGDFELRLDWKIGAGANSGIPDPVRLDASAHYETGPDFQI